RGGRNAIRAFSELPLVLPHRRRAVPPAVLPEAVAPRDLRARERAVALGRRTPCEEHPLRAEAAARVLRREPALLEPELVIRAPRDRVVALMRIERPLEDAQAVHELGDDEMSVRVAVAVKVAAL